MSKKSIRSAFYTTARIIVHVEDADDLDPIIEPILERFPKATLSDIRENSHAPFEGGKHQFVYLKASDLEGDE